MCELKISLSVAYCTSFVKTGLGVQMDLSAFAACRPPGRIDDAKQLPVIIA